MSSALKYLHTLSNQEIDEKIKILSPNISYCPENFYPTSDFLIANQLIEKENIIVKKNENNLFCIPVFEHNGKIYGILESSSYLRTAMLYYLARKTGVIQEI